MKIINLTSENIKRLTAVSITPNGNLVQITGANDNGKSSVLDSLWWALSDRSRIEKMPVRRGQKKGMTRLDLGELVVTRTYRANEDGSDYTTSLSVENAEGARFPSPNAVIEKLLGKLSIDALAFANATEREQFDILRAFVPGVDFESVERSIAEQYEKRTELNRQAKQLRALEAGALAGGNIPHEPADTDAIDAELQDLSTHNELVHLERARRSKEIAALDVEVGAAGAISDRIKQLRAALAQSEATLAEREERIRIMKGVIAGWPEEPATKDLSQLVAKGQLAREHNARYQKRLDATEFARKAEQIEIAAAAITVAMDEKRRELAQAVADSKMPVEGLTLMNGGVYLNDVPFSQASFAVKIRVSTAIAFASCGDLRVVRIREGSLLDETSLATVAKMADEHDVQVWIERVDTSGKVGFVIEDGHVKQQDAH